MHIALANQWFPPESGWGGVAMYNWSIAHAFHRLGHRVTVIASRWSQDIPAGSAPDGIRVLRLLVRDLYRLRRLPGLGRYVRPIQQLAYSARVNRFLRDLHARDPFEVVEFADVNAEGFSYARAPQSAFVVRCHTPTFILARYYDRREWSYDTLLIGACEKYAIRRAHVRSAPSRDMARTLAHATGVPVGKFTVIPNALPLADFKAAGAHPTLKPSDYLTILYVGRLERVKGVEILAQAIPSVISQIPNARFVFLGDDLLTTRGRSQRAELEEHLQNANVSSHVKFLTSVDHATLMESYRCADICVVPSMLYESFSYTCAQAMAAGKPVVASRIGGIPETVDDGVNGILCEPGNVEEIAQAIVRLARDARVREEMGRVGRERVEREFDAVKVAEKTLAVYGNAIAEFRRAKG